jgi:CRISPR-associated exonuclease Cas4
MTMSGSPKTPRSGSHELRSGGTDPAGASITVTHVLEHLYCPRFTYFEHVLTVPERQERRWKVQKGRAVHRCRQQINKAYLRKRLGVVERQIEVPLFSAPLGVRGVADEVLTLDDGSMAPFDYKFAKQPKQVYRNQRVQSALYGLLIRETFARPVHRGFLCYTRSKNKVVELPFDESRFAEAERIVREVLDVIQQGYLPRATRSRARCGDCCYRNICIQ